MILLSIDPGAASPSWIFLTPPVVWAILASSLITGGVAYAVYRMRVSHDSGVVQRRERNNNLESLYKYALDIKKIALNVEKNSRTAYFANTVYEKETALDAVADLLGHDSIGLMRLCKNTKFDSDEEIRISADILEQAIEELDFEMSKYLDDLRRIYHPVGVDETQPEPDNEYIQRVQRPGLGVIRQAEHLLSSIEQGVRASS